VAGAIQKEDYLGHIRETGFEKISIQKEKPIELPADILQQYLNDEEIAKFNDGGVGIFSITVFAQKTGSIQDAGILEDAELAEPGNGCCSPDSGCC
jgi:hypothetical protein